MLIATDYVRKISLDMRMIAPDRYGDHNDNKASHVLESKLRLLEKYQTDNEKISKDIPVLKEVVEAVWRKEDELKELKTELNSLDRQIQLSLKPIEETEGQTTEIAAGNQSLSEPVLFTASNQSASEPLRDAPLPHDLQRIKEAMGDRLVIVSINHGDKPERKETPAKGFRL